MPPLEQVAGKANAARRDGGGGAIFSRDGGVVAQVAAVRQGAAELGQRGARLGCPLRLRWRQPGPERAFEVAELFSLTSFLTGGVVPA